MDQELDFKANARTEDKMLFSKTAKKQNQDKDNITADMSSKTYSVELMLVVEKTDLRSHLS